MSEYRFVGKERVTIELDGTFDGDVALPGGLALDRVDGRARVSLFAFYVDDIRIAFMPLIKSSYAEVLWRLAVRAGPGDDAAWWVAACDLAAAGPAWAARRWVRYPVRKQPVEVSDSRIAIADSFALELGAKRDPALVEQRPLLTGSLFRVPWGDDASGAHRAEVRSISDALGRLTVGADITWSSTAIVRHGREHRCGVAQRR